MMWSPEALNDLALHDAPDCPDFRLGDLKNHNPKIREEKPLLAISVILIHGSIPPSIHSLNFCTWVSLHGPSQGICLAESRAYMS